MVYMETREADLYFMRYAKTENLISCVSSFIFRMMYPALSFSLPYKEFFGGVSGLTVEQFRKINGFPNAFWGWGGEDDDLWNRYDAVSTTYSHTCVFHERMENLGLPNSVVYFLFPLSVF